MKKETIRKRTKTRLLGPSSPRSLPRTSAKRYWKNPILTEIVTIETTDEGSSDETEKIRKSTNSDMPPLECISRWWRDEKKEWGPHIAALEKAIDRENMLNEANKDYRRKFSNTGLRNLVEHIRYKIKEE